MVVPKNHKLRKRSHQNLRYAVWLYKNSFSKEYNFELWKYFYSSLEVNHILITEYLNSLRIITHQYFEALFKFY